MLSRVAERIYWMARYLERAEDIARIINVNTHLVLDLPKKATLGWMPLIEITGNKRLFNDLYEEANERNVIRFMINDTNNGGSLLNSIINARENARTIRDIIPRDAWERVNNLHIITKSQLPQGLSRRNRYEFLHSVIGGIQLTTGLLAGTMTHNFGYDFLRIGRNLERADMTTRIVDVRSTNLLPEESTELVPYETIQWMSILQSLSAYENYRQFSQTRVQGSQVLKYLLQDTQFPRSFLHCLGEMQSSLQNLPRHRPPLRYLNQIIREMKTIDLESLKRKAAHRLLDDLQLQLAKFHKLVNDTYFTTKIETKTKTTTKTKTKPKPKKAPNKTNRPKKAATAHSKSLQILENRIG